MHDRFSTTNSVHKSFQVTFLKPHISTQALTDDAFAGNIDYAPYKHQDADGQRVWSNLMSADWAWKQAVHRSLILPFLDCAADGSPGCDCERQGHSWGHVCSNYSRKRQDNCICSDREPGISPSLYVTREPIKHSTAGSHQRFPPYCLSPYSKK
jgi:Plavaka transposase